MTLAMTWSQADVLAFEPAWTPAALRRVSIGLEGRPPEEVLRWGVEQFAPRLAMATGFGPEGVVVMHALSRVAPETAVFYLDTGLLFPETYALRDELARRLGLRFTRVAPAQSVAEQAAAHGDALWARDPDQCCRLRKVLPLRRYLAAHRAWITSIRREQTAARARAGVVEWDSANGLIKLNPLAGWTNADVWGYLSRHNLPYNPLHDQGYPSVGCWPCTRPVAAGADPRSGRWAGFNKTECGLHLPEGAAGGRAT